MYEQMTERDDILKTWELVLHASRNGDVDPATMLTTFKRLAFDTYWYFRRLSQFNSVLRDDLPIYRDACLFWMMAERGCESDWLNGCEDYATFCCDDVARGLCWSIENGFERGMHKVMMPLGLALPYNGTSEADMSSYKTYEKAFRRELVFFMREQIEMEQDELKDCDELEGDRVPLDEQEELVKIAATRDI